MDVIDNTTQEFITGSELPSPDYRNMTIGPLALDTYYEVTLSALSVFCQGVAVIPVSAEKEIHLIPNLPVFFFVVDRPRFNPTTAMAGVTTR